MKSHRRSHSITSPMEEELLPQLSPSRTPSPLPTPLSLPLPLQSPTSLMVKVYTRYPHLNVIISSILLWYIFSMSISVYNRWMFAPITQGGLELKSPILVTAFHQLLLSVLAACTLLALPTFRLTNTDTVGYAMPLREYAMKVLPCSMASAGDIGLGNTAFRFITLSLYTMVKTSSLVFVLLWGVVFGLERFTLKIAGIVGVMILGVSMMISGGDTTDVNTTSTALVFIGVSLVLASACMSGLRWALTQMMLKKNPRTRNPILTMMYVSPGMCLTLLLFGAIIEGLPEFTRATVWSQYGVFGTLILLIIPGILAFCMTIAEYVLLQYASLLTLSVSGIFKELLTIFVSWVVFGDRLSALNLIGLVVTFADIVMYNMYRFTEKEGASYGESEVENEFVDIELESAFVRRESEA